MNILFLNKFFYLKGSSERVFFEEMALLRVYQQRVIPFSRNHPENDAAEYDQYFAEELNIKNKMSLDFFKIIKEIIYSKNAKLSLKGLLNDHPIDIAHAITYTAS